MRVFAALAAVVLALSACGSSGGGAQAGGPALLAALARVKDTADTRAFVEFGRPEAAIAANGGLDPSGPYYRAVGFGMANLIAQYRAIRGATGIDLTAATFAVSAGNPPKTGLLLAGLDLKGTRSRLEGMGAKRSGSGARISYRFRPDGKVSMDDRLARALPGVITQFNVIELDGKDLRAGASAEAVSQTRAAGKGLLAESEYRDVAACLDDPLAAVLTDRPRPSAGGVELVGVGLSGAKGETPIEQLCMASTDAKSTAERVRTALTSGTSARTQAKWTELLSDAKVSVKGDVVQVTAHARKTPGLLLVALVSGDLPGLG